MYLRHKKRKICEVYDYSELNHVNKSNKFMHKDLIKNIDSSDNINNVDDSESDNTNNTSKDEDKLIYLKNNHLYFHNDITLESVDVVKKLMRTYWDELNKISKMTCCIHFKPKPLYIHIFSNGGCVYSGFSLYDFIIEYKKKIPVYTVIEGIVASAATFVSIAGTKRFITPNSNVLIHQLSTSSHGNFQRIKDDFENSKKCMDKIMAIYETNAKINKKKLNEILKHEHELDANEALLIGLVDEIKLIDVFNDEE